MKANLKTWRERKRLSQEGLARAVDVSTKTIWRYENEGFKSANVHTVNRITDVLEIDLSQLILEEETK